MSTPNPGHASLIGATFAGYRVVGLVGRGATGAVYLAHDLTLRRPVALKVMLGSLARNPAMVERFKHEARAAAPLRHPHIVRVYNAGIAEGTPFLAMEYVEGEPLDRFLRRKGQVPWQTALYIGAQVADALSCAHEAGVVHRDVKPANILLDRAGRARLTDFGIANIHEPGGAGTNGFAGTPHYMAPEQCGGRPVSAEADLFSLGVMLYRMIGGALPFEADTPFELVRKIHSHEPPRLNKLLPDVPDDVARAVAHLMAKAPESRPESAASVRGMLSRLQAERGGRSALPTALAAFIAEQAEVQPVRGLAPGRLTAAGRPGPGGAAGWLRRRRDGLAIAAAAAVGAAVAVGVVYGVRPEPAAAAAPLTAAFAAPSGEPRVIPLASSAYRIDRIVAVGGGRFAVFAGGAPGSAAAGAQGILGVDAGAGRVVSIRPPLSPYWDAPGLTAPEARIAAYAGGAVGDDALLLPGLLAADGPATTLVRQDFTNMSGGTAAARIGLSDRDAALTAIARHPDGIRFAAVEVSSATGAAYIEEYALGEGRTGRRIVPAGALDGASVVYGAGGSALLYRTLDERGASTWWADFADGRRLALAAGDASGAAAVSPDGRHIVIALREAGDAERTLRRIDVETGAAGPSLGLGRCGPGGWFADGRAAVAAPGADGGPDQIWLLDPATGARSPLTAVPEGVSGAPVGSHDGKWVAAAANGTTGLVLAPVPEDGA